MIDNEANKSLTIGRFSGIREGTTADTHGSKTGDLRKLSGLKTKVLVVDVDAMVVHSLAGALRAAGYNTLEATSFADAKRLLVTESPQVLVADVRLGQFNGLQLLMRAKEERPDTAAVITCAFPDVVLEAETRRFGGIFLLKPLHPQQVLTAIGAHTQPQFFVERRAKDRRTIETARFSPERRVSERRIDAVSVERRSADRRQLLIANFSPERRNGKRRIGES